MNRPGRLSDPDALWKIEAAVDDTPFLGIGVGPTLNDFLLQLTLNAGVSSLLELSRAVRMALPSRQRRPPERPLEGGGRLLFTWMRDTPRMTELVLPLIGELGGPSCAVVGSQASMRSRLPPGCEFYLENNLGPERWTRWATEFGRTAPRWLRALRRTFAETSLPATISPLIATALVQQSRQVTTFLGALEIIRPRAVITEFDRGAFASPLILAARALDIPTLTLVHGAVSEHGLTPLIADIALCWGDDQVEAFVRAGTSPERLVVTGCHRTGLSPSPDAADMRRRLGLPDEGEVVVLATSNGPLPAERLRFARVFCEAMAGRAHATALLRVHPMERPEDYAEVVVEHPFLQVIDDTHVSVAETFAITSLLVCGDSTIGVDAVLHDRPVALLELGSALLDGSRLAMGGGGPVAHSATELTSILDRFLGDGGYRRELTAIARGQASRICAAVGAEAAANVAAAIMERAVPGYGGSVSDIDGRADGRLPA